MGWPPEPGLNLVENAILAIEPVDSAGGHWVASTRTRVQNQWVLASQQDSCRTLLLTEGPDRPQKVLDRPQKVPESPGRSRKVQDSLDLQAAVGYTSWLAAIPGLAEGHDDRVDGRYF